MCVCASVISIDRANRLTNQQTSVVEAKNIKRLLIRTSRRTHSSVINQYPDVKTQPSPSPHPLSVRSQVPSMCQHLWGQPPAAAAHTAASASAASAPAPADAATAARARRRRQRRRRQRLHHPGPHHGGCKDRGRAAAVRVIGFRSRSRGTSSSSSGGGGGSSTPRASRRRRRRGRRRCRRPHRRGSGSRSRGSGGLLLVASPRADRGERVQDLWRNVSQEVGVWEVLLCL